MSWVVCPGMLLSFVKLINVIFLRQNLSIYFTFLWHCVHIMCVASLRRWRWLFLEKELCKKRKNSWETRRHLICLSWMVLNIIWSYSAVHFWLMFWIPTAVMQRTLSDKPSFPQRTHGTLSHTQTQTLIEYRINTFSLLLNAMLSWGNKWERSLISHFVFFLMHS